MVRRTSLIISEILAGLIAGMIALGGLAAWRLHSGPVPLDFMTSHLEAALRDSDAGFNVDIENTELVWAGWRHAVDIRARGVSVTRADGTALARVPQMSLGLSLKALARGNIAPTGLDVFSPSIKVVRQETGEIALGFAEFGGEDDEPEAGAHPAEAEAGGMDVVRYLISELRAEEDPDRPLSYLNRISIVDARIVFDDRLANAYYRTTNATITAIEQADGSIRAEAGLVLQYDERTADIAAEVALGRDGQEITADFAFHDVVPAGFVASLPQLEPLTALKMPLYGEATVKGRMDGALDSVSFDVVGGVGKLELTDFFREPLDVGGLRLRAVATDDFKSIEIDQAVVALDGPTIFAKARLAPEDGDTKIMLAAQSEGLSMAELDRYWPPSLAAGQRKWVTRHIATGLVKEATMEVSARMKGGSLGAVALESMGGKLVYSDLSVDYYEGMPEFVGITGEGTYNADGLKLGIVDGRIYEKVAVTGGQVDIFDISTLKDGGIAKIDIDVGLSGPVQATMEVLDHDPLNYGRKLGFDPKQLGGDMTAKVNFKFPLTFKLTTRMLDISAQADIVGATVADGPVGLDIGDGALKLDLTQKAMRINGDVTLNGVPAAIDWRENFADKSKFERTIDVTGRVNDAQRLALGLPDLSYWVKGPGEGKLTYTTYPGQADKLTLRTDVAAAALTMPEIDWRKEAGAPGTLDIDGTVNGKTRLVFDRMHLKTDDMDARVRMEFLPDLSDVKRIDFDDVRYRGNDLKGSMVLKKDGGYRIEVNGKHIDARYWLDEATKPAVKEGLERGRSLSIKAIFDEVITGENRFMYTAGFNGEYDGRNWTTLIINSTLGQGAPFSLNFQPDSNEYKLKITSEDAGQALRSLDWWDEIQGGAMVIEARSKTVDGALVGTFHVKDFRMRSAPTGLKLLQVITIIGLPAAAEEGVSFVGLEGSFRIHKGFMRFGEVQAWGPVGVNVDKGGWMDFNKGTLGMTGVVIPANNFQGILGLFPFLGDGLISANFGISGPLENPIVKSSKASLLAPGFLKKLFRVTPKTEEEEAVAEEERKKWRDSDFDPNAVPNPQD